MHGPALLAEPVGAGTPWRTHDGDAGPCSSECGARIAVCLRRIPLRLIGWLALGGRGRAVAVHAAYYPAVFRLPVDPSGLDQAGHLVVAARALELFPLLTCVSALSSVLSPNPPICRGSA